MIENANGTTAAVRATLRSERAFAAPRLWTFFDKTCPEKRLLSVSGGVDHEYGSSVRQHNRDLIGFDRGDHPEWVLVTMASPIGGSSHAI